MTRVCHARSQRDSLDYTATDGSLPVDCLIVLRGCLEGIKADVLKDDGCSTNVISRDFALRHANVLDIRDSEMTITHSKRGSEEKSLQIAVGARIQIGGHDYLSNWAIADCRHDVLLGMPWHKSCAPTVDYCTPAVQVDGEWLPVKERSQGRVTVTSLGVKKFRSLLRKRGHREDFEVYQLVPQHKQVAFQSDDRREKKPEEEGLKRLLSRYAKVFREDLPAGLPPKRDVDHAIETDLTAKPPLRPLYQLSPAELVAVKDYTVDLMRKGKIRRSKSPYGASLFFVKEKGKLRAVVDYRALNRMTKRNNTPLPRPDEMFDRLGDSCYFSKLDLKTGFHQIRVRPQDVEKTASLSFFE